MTRIKQRESNIELLRLVIMAFIVLHHFIFHGLGQYRYLALGASPLLSGSQIDCALIVDSFLIAAVDVFILISGYFSIKLKASSFVKLFSIVSFFAIVGFCNYLYINGLSGGVIISIAKVFKRGFFVVSNSTFWFIQYYFILMFLSGAINKYVEVASKKSLLSTIYVLLFVNIYLGWIREVAFVTDGYNLTNFIMLYLIGRYLKLHYKKNIAKKYDLILFLCSSIITAILAVTLYHFGLDTYRAFCYNSPFVLVSAVSLFMLFSKVQYQSKVVNYLAASCLAIYLMQEGGINGYSYIKSIYLLYGVTPTFWFWIGLFFILSMLLPLIVDKIRLMIFARAENKASQIIDNHVFKRFFE